MRSIVSAMTLPYEVDWLRYREYPILLGENPNNIDQEKRVIPPAGLVRLT
jgi:hypothetical protein